MSKTVFWIASTALLAALAGAWIVGAWRWQAGTEALRAGDPVVAVARFTHTGSFNMGSVEPKWSAFRSDQLVVTQRPGFDWDGRIAALPGVAVHVHDALVAGQGLLQARLAGLVSVADVPPSPQLAEGELMRYLAEAPWYPTALLPSRGVQWRGLDASRAEASLVDGPNRVRLVFGFGADGLIERIEASARGRTVGDRVVMTPW